MSRTLPGGGSKGIKAKYNSSNVLEFLDNSGDVIYSLDPNNRKLTIPSGSTLAMSGTQQFDDIVGIDSSLALTGAAPASVTSAGGAVVVTGGIGGATSGIGGAVSNVGGVGTAGNSAGGAVSYTGGAGQGSANGGVASLVGGIGGATGDGGAVSITGGSSGGASDTGGAVNIAGGPANSGTIGAVNVAAGGTSDTLGFHGTTAVVQASGLAALASHSAGANGQNTTGEASALHALVVAIRLCLVNNGLMAAG